MKKQSQSYYPCDRVEVHLLSHVQRHKSKTWLCHILALGWWKIHLSNICLSLLICKVSKFNYIPSEMLLSSNTLWILRIQVIVWRPTISGVWWIWQSGWFTRLCWWAVRAVVLKQQCRWGREGRTLYSFRVGADLYLPQFPQTSYECGVAEWRL